MTSDKGITTSRDGNVMTVRLSRPEKLNALNIDVLRSLVSVVDELADDLEVRVVVLRGEGRTFSAGADLSAGAPAGSGKQRTWAERRHLSGGWQRFLDRFEALRQVTVAGLRGHCIGGAALIAAACDIRVADPTLQIRIPELAIGIPLTWGGNPRLVREIGLPLTRDLVMTGRAMDADEALRCGFVQRLVGDGDLDNGVQQVVDELIAMPDAPLQMTKAMMNAIGRDQMGSIGWADADLLAWSGGEPEGIEAAARYVEERARRKR